MKKKRYILKFCACIALVFTICLSAFFSTKVEAVKNSSIVISYQDVQQTKDLFDYYEQTNTDKLTRITAFKEITGAELSGIENVSIGQDEELDTAYDVQYDQDAEMIYLTISIFNKNEELIYAQAMEAFPIYMEDGSIDALFEIDGNYVYLSEIINGNNENCFFFTLTMSLFAAKLVAAAIITAKVVVAVTAVVAIGYTTYKVVEITREKIKERERVAIKEKSKKNPKVYYPATRKSGKLLIAASPLGLIAASKAIITGVDFWSPFGYNAKDLAVTASGGSVGPEVDSKKDGYYFHYHLLGRVGGHSFYGLPVGGIF